MVLPDSGLFGFGALRRHVTLIFINRDLPGRVSVDFLSQDNAMVVQGLRKATTGQVCMSEI